MRHVAVNQRLTIRQAEALATPAPGPRPLTPLLNDVTDQIGLPYTHHENDFVDFDREPLIPKLLSTEGPMLAVAELNGGRVAHSLSRRARGPAGEPPSHPPHGR